MQRLGRNFVVLSGWLVALVVATRFAVWFGEQHYRACRDALTFSSAGLFLREAEFTRLINVYAPGTTVADVEALALVLAVSGAVVFMVLDLAQGIRWLSDLRFYRARDDGEAARWIERKLVWTSVVTAAFVFFVVCIVRWENALFAYSNAASALADGASFVPFKSTASSYQAWGWLALTAALTALLVLIFRRIERRWYAFVDSLRGLLQPGDLASVGQGASVSSSGGAH